MDIEDITALIKASDAVLKLDEILDILTGNDHSNGNLIELDNISEVLLKYSDSEYATEEGTEQFFRILRNTGLAPEKRAQLLTSHNEKKDLL